MMAETLLFKNPTFHKGVNVTVRDGLKWDMIVDQLPKSVPFGETDGEVLGTAMIIGKMVMPASTVPDEVLSLEHDESCRSLEGLIEGMQRAYGESWSPSNTVTVLFFVTRYPHV